MNNVDNLKSYNDVEKVQLTLSDVDFEKYCSDKLESAKGNVAFIREHIYDGKPMSVCEIGSGNSKLLYSLERESIINEAVGYEVSEARYRFAEKWKEKIGIKKVRNIHSNFLDDNSSSTYDLIIFVDIVFQIVANLYDGAEDAALSWVYSHLSRGGVFCLR